MQPGACVPVLSTRGAEGNHERAAGAGEEEGLSSSLTAMTLTLCDLPSAGLGGAQ